MGRISACVASMNFLRSLLEKGHQVSPQGKRRDQILEALSIGQAEPRGTAVTTSPQALAFCPKNPGSSSDSATWTLCMFCKTPAEQRWWEMGGNRGWGRILLWDLHWDWKLFLVWWPGGAVSQMAAPSAWEVGQGTPEPPVHPLTAQAGGVAHSSQPDTFTSAALLISVSLVLPVLSQGGGQQDTASLVMISLALLCGLVWVCCFSHHPYLQLRYGEESSACSTGRGYCDLLFLLAVRFPLPLRSLSRQMLSMPERGFALCDHYSQTSSPSGLDYLICVSELLYQYLTHLWDLPTL